MSIVLIPGLTIEESAPINDAHCFSWSSLYATVRRFQESLLQLRVSPRKPSPRGAPYLEALRCSELRGSPFFVGPMSVRHSQMKILDFCFPHSLSKLVGIHRVVALFCKMKIVNGWPQVADWHSFTTCYAAHRPYLWPDLVSCDPHQSRN